MAPNARNIRKIERSKVADFDDQLWPINCAILILAGCVVGVILGKSDFAHDHPFHNGWTHLIAVAVMVGLLFWGVVWLQGKMLRRLQLCILISLLAHLWLAVYLHQQYLALLAQRETEDRARVVEQYQEITVPDYHWEQIEEPELHEDFDKPIETEAPKPTEPESIQREADAPPMPTELERADEPEVPQRQQPNPAIARRAELSAPRRADAAAGAQISRQEWKHRPRPNEPIPEPELTAQTPQAAAVPSPDIAPRRRESSAVSVDQRQTFEEPASSRDEPIPVNLARRAAEQQPTTAHPTTPSPSRQIARAADVPRTMAAAPKPVRVAQPTPRTDRPRSITPMTARRQADAPAMVRQTTETAPTAPSTATLAASTHRKTQASPQPAQAVRSAPVRKPSAMTSPTTSRPQMETVAAETPTETTSSVPTPRQAAATSGPKPADVAQQATTATATDSTAIARSTTRRAAEAAEASTGARAARPTTSRAAPQVAATRIEQATTPTAAARLTTPRLFAARPDASTVSRSAEGASQAVEQELAGRELPTMTSAAQLPAALAARRSAATRQDPADSARSPSRPTTLARSSAGVSLPSTTIAAESQPAAMPAATGSATSSRVNQVASSAAVRRDAANPAAGDSAGAAGSAEYAVGSAPLVARSGQPRSTGAGRASAAANGPVARLARSSGPAPSVAASGTPGLVAAAPGSASSATARASLPAFNSQASAAKQGGTVRPLASQSVAGSGPSGSSGTSGAVGASSSSRVTRHESVASAMSGGGTPRPGRTAGAASAPDATAEASAVAATQPGGASDRPAMHTMALTTGPRRQVAGLPGSVQSQPRSGAIASLTDEGAPLAASVARRSPGSSKNAGGSDVGATRTVTMHRTTRGTDLPTAAVAMVETPRPGAHGIAAAQGGQPSSLPTGKTATVRRAAGDVAAGSQTVAAGTTESATGSARAVAMAGRMRASGNATPQLSAGSVASRNIARATSGRPAFAPTGTIDARPVAEVVAGGPSGLSDENGENSPSSPAMGNAVAQGAAGGMTAAQPAEATGTLAVPGGAAVAATRSGRAERNDAAMAAATAGGRRGPRRTMGAPAATGTADAAPELAQVGPSTGGTDAAPETAAHVDPAGAERMMAGLPGELVDRIVVETALEAGPAATTPGTMAGARRMPAGNNPGASIAARVGRGPLRKTDAPGLPRGVAQSIEEQPIAAAAATAGSGDATDPAEGTAVGRPSRQEGGLPVQIAAMAGPGGLSHDPLPEVGLPSRHARRESEIIHTVSRRFIIERSGGRLAVDGRISEQPTEAFRQRDPGLRADIAQTYGGSEGTEEAVEMGLDYMARHQFPDGHWSLHELPEGLEYDDPGLGVSRSDSAATGLALLTYLGTGYTHLDKKYRAVVDRGIQWLVRNQEENGDLFSKTGGTKAAWFYSHGIATIALCEAYGMTRDSQLREPAQKAIDFLVKSQHSHGGWRYRVDAEGRSTETDTSVTGWQLMALKSAQMAELDVPQQTLDRIDDWLDRAEAKTGDGRYVYHPYARGSATRAGNHGNRPSLAMTAEAMLMRMYLGHGNDDPKLIAGADHLKKNLPAVGTPRKSLRDCYYWYYATQAMFQMQGDYWTAWNERMRPMFKSSQAKTGPMAGSWNPSVPVRDAWGHAGGRHYVTAMHLLMLEVHYRHLPLFEQLGK